MPRLSRVPLARLLRVVAVSSVAFVGLATGSARAADDIFAPPCPRPGILANAGDLYRYLPTGHDLTDLQLQARVIGLQGTCQQGDKPNTTKVKVTIQLDVTRGPAATGHTADLAYFIAVLRGSDILDKKIYSASAEFPANAAKLGLTSDPVELNLPTPKGVTAADYRILIGLQLTPEQLEQNRQRAAHRS
jgi:hypothetical protein